MNLTFWATAQAKPWMRVGRGSGNGATLCANPTLALNVDTGQLAWHYNHAPGESLDLDEVFERVLVDDQGQTPNGGGSPRKVPRLLATDVHYSETGNALFVFALPDRR